VEALQLRPMSVVSATSAGTAHTPGRMVCVTIFTHLCENLLNIDGLGAPPPPLPAMWLSPLIATSASPFEPVMRRREGCRRKEGRRTGDHLTLCATILPAMTLIMYMPDVHRGSVDACAAVIFSAPANLSTCRRGTMSLYYMAQRKELLLSAAGRF